MKVEESWESRFLKWFLTLLFLTLIVNIWVFILIHEEPRRGIITLEMLIKKDFFQPTVLGIPYFKKPPFHEWITSAISVLLGEVSEFSLRLPSAISVVLTSVVLFYVNKHFFKERVALFSAIIYSTFYIVLIGYGSKCEPDTLFSLLITLATLGWFFFFEKQRELAAWITGYMFTSFALLTKGLPAIQFFS
ncbi:glycosyltransferase family 39 protein, partial [Desulfurobacterium sp.]|uniref:ArnT family glycosyltransferase n=1 Tax=Desulfurobacterium sp. TaxID=2004706 RepID=UPI002613A4DE